MSNLFFVLFVTLLLSSCDLSTAKASDDKAKPQDIQVEVGKVTEVVFPTKIAKIVKGGQPDSVLVEVLDDSVYLLPKTDDPSDIFVTTIDSNSYPLKLHVGQDHDIKIQISSKNKLAAASTGTYADVMDLMKELLLGHEPSSATLLPMQGRVLLSNGQIKLTVHKAYELGDWKAYVIDAKNQSNNAVILPLEQISLPDLLAITSDRDMLAAKGREGDVTKVYIITGNQNEF